MSRIQDAARRAFMLRRLVLVALLVSFETGGASPRKVTQIVIRKKDHELALLAGNDVVRRYRVALGPGSPGPKLREGDATTPTGRYHVTMHQPSQYRWFLRLDYPNAEDLKRFDALKRSGALPRDAKIGGDIGIHGPPVSAPDLLKLSYKLSDWTLGCIAVDDEEIQEIARLVKDGTDVTIEE